ncbi:hypothetical protein ACMCNP_04795 [Candidatus Acidulodesulfobacterium sp. H_13]|uniref:hypothetical protein n=1 Tax=Candidatus Acidulodesulfobacterium sp. H_13 TaxID=3395470 RepID=UPI003AF5A8D4
MSGNKKRCTKYLSLSKSYIHSRQDKLEYFFYRYTLINHKWFWEMQNTTLYFMAVSFTFFVLGAIVFKRLRPHFGDVL